MPTTARSRCSLRVSRRPRFPAAPVTITTGSSGPMTLFSCTHSSDMRPLPEDVRAVREPAPQHLANLVLHGFDLLADDVVVVAVVALEQRGLAEVDAVARRVGHEPERAEQRERRRDRKRGRADELAHLRQI